MTIEEKGNGGGGGDGRREGGRGIKQATGLGMSFKGCMGYMTRLLCKRRDTLRERETLQVIFSQKKSDPQSWPSLCAAIWTHTVT